MNQNVPISTLVVVVVGIPAAMLVGTGVFRALGRRRIGNLASWNAANLFLFSRLIFGGLAGTTGTPLWGSLADIADMGAICCFASASFRIFGEGPPRLIWSLAVALPLVAGGAFALASGSSGAFDFAVALVATSFCVTTVAVLLHHHRRSGIPNGPGLLAYIFGIEGVLQFLRAIAALEPRHLPPLIASLTSEIFGSVSSLALFLVADFFLALILMTKLEIELSERADEAARGQRELKLLYDAFAGTAGTVDPVELHHKILDLIQERLGADAVVIYLEDREGEGLFITAQRGLDGLSLALLARPDPRLSVAGVAFERKASYVRHIADYEAGPLRDALAGIGLAVIGGFPIAVGGSVIGVMTAGYREEGKLDSMALATLETLALQLGAVISAANLHAKLDRANARLSELASTDMLTALANRRAALQALDREIARSKRAEGLVAVIMGDLDRFKSFNDRYGHDCGDYVLTNTAAIIADTVRATDIPSRWGGEEFLIVLGESEPEGAMKLAERLRERIESASWNFGGRELSVTMTLGVGLSPPAAGAEAVIALADKALYMGKRAGRNRVTMLIDDGSEPRPGEASTSDGRSSASAEDGMELLPIVEPDEVV